jgi:hypothetical protein
MKEFLGHAAVTSSEREARLSNLKVKPVYFQTIRRVMAQTKVSHGGRTSQAGLAEKAHGRQCEEGISSEAHGLLHMVGIRLWST